MVGDEIPATQVWAYNSVEPGPLLRLRQGSRSAMVENRLDQVTTVHWHGIRLPNAMDGVPGLTQPPIKPGGHSSTNSPRLMPGPSGTTRTPTVSSSSDAASPAR